MVITTDLRIFFVSDNNEWSLKERAGSVAVNCEFSGESVIFAVPKKRRSPVETADL
jgi:hypothetical protein